MAHINDTPPTAVQSDLDSLASALDLAIPPKTDDNLLIGTWNIRSFASLTRKWTALGTDSPKRDLRGLRAIIDISRRFDVLAIQELRGDLRAPRDTMHFLGSDGAFLMTDVTQGGAGNSERLAFLYDRTRVHPSGLACELVVPPERLSRIGPDLLISQFARTPYAVSFKRKNTTFILTTLHVLFGSAPSSRIGELKEIADWMSDWAKRSHRFEHNLLTLGDFNIDRTGSPLYDAFVSTGLTIRTFCWINREPFLMTRAIRFRRQLLRSDSLVYNRQS